LSAAENAHIGRVYMVEEGLAAAIGAGVAVDDPHASAVVDIGAGTTNAAVVAHGTIVHARAERIGSSDIDAAIIDRLRRHRGLTIGPATAERLKIELGSAVTDAEGPERKLTVKGRDVQTGNPGAIEVTAGEVHAVTLPVIHKIAEEVRLTLAALQPEVAADIFDRGIVLTGGGALLPGLQQYLHAETGLVVRMADEPRLSIVRGLAQLFDEPLLLRRVARNEPHPLLDAEESAFES
jgi:rod shape-determining protein MreB